jgi:hypothetical protein
MRHGKTGFVISGTQPAAWVYTLGRLLRDKALRTRMGSEAREYALTRRWEVALRPLYRSYHDVLVARAAGRQATLEPLGEPIA